MEDIYKKIHLNDIQGPISYNGNGLSHIRFGSPLVVSSSNVTYSNNEEQTICPSTDSSLQQHDTSMSDVEHKYRIHVGTQPGYYTDKHITFQESQNLHLQTIDLLEKFLNSCNIKFEIIKNDAFSTGAWGLEPYACIILTCSNEMAKGMAAIIGLALRQDAIGIYTDNDGYSHTVYTVSPVYNSSITEIDALHIMKIIKESYKDLSAQFDRYGQVLEFHDFDNQYDSPIISEQLMEIVNNYVEKDLFQVEKSIDKSSLLEKADYEEAIKQADLEILSDIIELTRFHDITYNKPKSQGKDYIHGQIREPRF